MENSAPNLASDSAASGSTEQLQATILQLHDRMARQAERLADVTHELEAFAFSMSHDLRAPLRGILGYVKSLTREHAASLDPNAQRALGRIRAEAEGASRLIADLDTYSRSGRDSLDPGAIDMTALAQGVFQQLVEAGEGPAPMLHLTDLPPARGDRAMMRTIFSHLIANAVKFSGRRPDALIRISGTTEAHFNRYAVCDNGAGFDPKYGYRLFGLFQRLHRADDFPGSGVGLAIVQRLVHRHGGRAWADGTIDGGANFYFSIPHPADQPT